ncbi:MAG: ATP-binding cassette domain-containing protein [Pseudomonadota bacterium]
MSLSGGGGPAPPLLTVEGARKTYGAVQALRGVDFSLAPGEVHAVCGDNGAGKSTLIKLISGVEEPDAGAIRLRGEPKDFGSPEDALQAGIATIHQDLGLVPGMTIWQNIFLGSELERRVLGLKLLDRAAMISGARAYLGRLNATLEDMELKVDALSGGQRQAVALSRALRRSAEIIIMDEPTAALGVRETAKVLDLIRALKAQGAAVILVSHGMAEVAAVADRATILRAGRADPPFDVPGLTAEDLSRRVLEPLVG